MEKSKESPESDLLKVAGPKEPINHPNDLSHNAEDYSEIFADLQREARILNIQDFEDMDRNELIEAVARARDYEARRMQPLDL